MKRYSISQLGTFMRCAMQWMWRYAENIKSPPGVAATLGKGVDASVTANLNAKIGGAALSFKEAQEVARDAVATAWKDEEPRVSEDDRIQTVGACQDAAIGLAGLHHSRVAPEIKPIGVQVKREMAPEGCDFTLLGYIDVLEEGRIRDTKTTGKKPDPEATERGGNADQLTVYDMMEGGGKQLTLDYLVNTSKPYQVIMHGNVREPEDHAKVLDKFQRMHMSIEAGVFMPTAADSWQCSAKWCGYFDRCPHGARGAKLIPLAGLTKQVSNDPTSDIDW